MRSSLRLAEHEEGQAPIAAEAHVRARRLELEPRAGLLPTVLERPCISYEISPEFLNNEYLAAEFGFDTAKNEPRQVLHFLAGKFE